MQKIRNIYHKTLKTPFRVHFGCLFTATSSKQEFVKLILLILFYFQSLCCNVIQKNQKKSVHRFDMNFRKLIFGSFLPLNPITRFFPPKNNITSCKKLEKSSKKNCWDYFKFFCFCNFM